jgi:hypothetical protein
MKAILTRGQMITAAESGNPADPLIDSGVKKPAVVGPWETLRSAAEKMAQLKLRSFPVTNDEGELVGILNIEDLLEARGKASVRERERERILRLRWPFGQKEDADSGLDDLVDRAFDSANRKIPAGDRAQADEQVEEATASAQSKQ